MIPIFGENYYIDIERINEYVNVVNVDDSDELEPIPNDNHISVVKFEMVKTMIDVILSEVESVDESLGSKATGLTIPFKLAFNTLLNKKIINKY